MPSNIQPIFKFSQLFQNVIQFLLIRKVFNWNMICTHFYICECKAWWIIQKWILLCKPVLFSRSRDSIKFQSFQGLFCLFSPLFSRIFFLPLFFFFQKLNLWGDKSNWLLQSSFPPHLLSSSSFSSPSPLAFSPFPPFLLSLLWKISNILLIWGKYNHPTPYSLPGYACSNSPHLHP